MTSPAYGVLPDRTELRRMKDSGMTHQQIADEVEKRTGQKVTRNAVTMAMARHGLSGNPTRYSEEIPWRVRQKHERHYALAMLRLYARRRRGVKLSREQEQRLTSWLGQLHENDRVVYYQADSPEGFYYVPRLPEDGDGIIRRPEEEQEPSQV
jgi:hypothetical protein